jgi:Cof subfamily protein (haloacid dehalogenase superfamily)
VGEKDVVEVSLLAVDLDGTLLTSEGIPAPRSAALLKRVAQDGVHVVLATARNPDSVRPLCYLLELDGPMICTNGAQVWGSPDGPVWLLRCIPLHIALAIAEWADAHAIELSTTIGSTIYWRRRPGQALGQIAASRMVVPTNADAIVDEPTAILVHEPEGIDGIRSLCQSAFPGQCCTQTYYDRDGTARSLGVYAPNTDKGLALGCVLDRLGVKREQVVVIGDDISDLRMFPYARVRVAMGNARREVKRRATVVAPSNDEEGVAWAVETFVL